MTEALGPDRMIWPDPSAQSSYEHLRHMTGPQLPNFPGGNFPGGMNPTPMPRRPHGIGRG